MPAPPVMAATMRAMVAASMTVNGSAGLAAQPLLIYSAISSRPVKGATGRLVTIWHLVILAGLVNGRTMPTAPIRHRQGDRGHDRVAEPALGPVYPVIFIDAISVKIRDGRSPTGPSTWHSRSPVRAAATSSGSGPGRPRIVVVEVA